MSSHHSDDASSVSSLGPRGELQAELPEALPKLLDQLQIEYDDLHLINDDSGYNIVWGYTDKSDSSKWVIRIPIQPFDEDGTPVEELTMEDQLATLRFLEPLGARFGSIPKVKVAETSDKNPIKRPYMIQTFIPGQRLADVQDELSHEEKRQVVTMLIELWLALESIRFPRSGNLVADPDHPGGVKVGEFIHRAGARGSDHDPKLSVYAWMKSRIDASAAAIKERDGGWTPFLDAYCRLYTVLEEMQEIGFFEDDEDGAMSKATLYHTDLSGGNILVKRHPETNELRLSGVIDWDYAEARPALLGRQPPNFMWVPEGVFEDEDVLMRWNQEIEQLPQKYWADMSEQDKDYKRIFDELMTSRSQTVPGLGMYMDDACGRGVWVRRLAQFAMWGVGDYVGDYMLDCLCEEWIDYFSKEHGKQSRVNPHLKSVLKLRSEPESDIQQPDSTNAVEPSSAPSAAETSHMITLTETADLTSTIPISASAASPTTPSSTGTVTETPVRQPSVPISTDTTTAAKQPKHDHTSDLSPAEQRPPDEEPLSEKPLPDDPSSDKSSSTASFIKPTSGWKPSSLRDIVGALAHKAAGAWRNLVWWKKE